MSKIGSASTHCKSVKTKQKVYEVESSNNF